MFSQGRCTLLSRLHYLQNFKVSGFSKGFQYFGFFDGFATAGFDFIDQKLLWFSHPCMVKAFLLLHQTTGMTPTHDSILGSCPVLCMGKTPYCHNNNPRLYKVFLLYEYAWKYRPKSPGSKNQLLPIPLNPIHLKDGRKGKLVLHWYHWPVRVGFYSAFKLFWKEPIGFPGFWKNW